MRGRENTLLKKFLICLFLTVFLSSATCVKAASSDSYTRVDIPGDTTEVRLSREMYTASKEVSAASLGLEEAFEGITDIFCTDSGKIYLLCGEKSRLTEISSDYSSARDINVTDDGTTVDFSGAKGVYCDGDGNIYIADTSNSRILITDRNGILKKTLEAPVSSLIPEDFLYQPTAVAKDDQGYIYILSLGCYYGALLYNPEYEFMGFYGANTVESSALDTLSYLWDKLTSNEKKKSSSVKKLPYSFSDFSFDSEGYMVTCTGSINNSIYQDKGVGQIKKISHNGSNILYKRNLNGESETSSSVDFLESQYAQGAGTQELVSVDVSYDDYIFALDRGNGVIYIYDSECNLMSAFGGGFGEGDRLGLFKKPSALTFNGNSVLVADEAKLSFTVFEPTEYGTLLRQAQTLYIKGNYEEAKELWEKVLKLNRNCQLAYRGLAMAYYNSGDYEAALEAARIAVDYFVYDLAWKEIASDFVADNFIVILLIIVAVAAAIISLIYYLRKNNKRLIRNPRLLLLFRAPFHPFETFDDLKYKKMGSLKIAVAITGLFYLASVLNVTASGFLYTNTLLRNYNSLYTLGGTIGLLLLWSVCNWLVCSMFNGKGNFKEVYEATCYSIAPWVLFLFIKVILSNFLPLACVGIINGIETALLIYTFFLICVAMIKVHEYDFFKFILTGIVVVFFMILVIFVILMCAILIAQFGSFIVSVYDEVAHR